MLHHRMRKWRLVATTEARSRERKQSVLVLLLPEREARHIRHRSPLVGGGRRSVRSHDMSGNTETAG